VKYKNTENIWKSKKVFVKVNGLSKKKTYGIKRYSKNLFFSLYSLRTMWQKREFGLSKAFVK
jgi:hypothetical protein